MKKRLSRENRKFMFDYILIGEAMWKIVKALNHTEEFKKYAKDFYKRFEKSEKEREKLRGKNGN